MGSGSKWVTVLPVLGIAFACSQTKRDFDPDSGPRESGAGADGGAGAEGGSDGETGGTSGSSGHADGGVSGSSTEPDGGAAGKPGAGCEEGQFADGGECTDFTTCEIGQYVSKEGSEDADRECGECTDGYSEAENAPSCTEWTICTWQDGGIAEAGTPTLDAVCGTPNAYRQFGTDVQDNANAVTVDASGNVYVVGFTEGDLDGVSGGRDAWVRKFAQDGAVLWSRQFGTSTSDTANAVAVDDEGNVYVAGSTLGALEGNSAGSTDVFVRRYFADGEVDWTRQFGSDKGDSVAGMTVDVTGNVYVVGGISVGTSSVNFDAYLRKYDASGTLQGSPVVFGTTAWDQASAVAVDGSGNVYVAGSTDGNLSGNSAGSTDAFVRKIPAGGESPWTTQFGTTALDYGTALFVDGDGNVYVAGYTGGDLDGSNSGFDDAYVAKLGPNGFALWTKQFGTAASDYARGLFVDADANVYVAGQTGGDLAGAVGGEDGFLRKYSSVGAVSGTRQFGSPETEQVRGVAVDASKNMFIAGATSGDLQGTTLGSDDAFVLQLAP